MEPAKEEAKKPEAAFEVLVIDDDDDVPAACESKQDDSVVAGKRPYPDDGTEKTDESSKKIRSSVEESVRLKIPRRSRRKLRRRRRSLLWNQWNRWRFRWSRSRYRCRNL